MYPRSSAALLKAQRLDLIAMSRSPRFVPYARRVEYAGTGRHHATRSRRPWAWAVSLFRDAADSLVGAFVVSAA
jgi:hypothetical protein